MSWAPQPLPAVEGPADDFGGVTHLINPSLDAGTKTRATATVAPMEDGGISTPSEDEWPALLVLAHVRTAALIRENHELRDEIEQMTAEHCDTCGARPCRNPSFCDACRRADRQAKPQSRGPIERRPTPQTTIEAIMYCVRERGIAALKEPGNVERLSRCDAAAKAEINKRIART